MCLAVTFARWHPCFDIIFLYLTHPQITRTNIDHSIGQAQLLQNVFRILADIQMKTFTFFDIVFADDDLLVIREVFVDVPLAGQATIIGEGFGTAPTVEFGEFGETLIVFATDTEIIIDLPTADAGDYLIIVTASGGG